MDMIYLDNAATSFPKPDVVADSVYEYIKNTGANISRGAYRSSYDAETMVFETRELLKDMFGASDSKNVVFTKNITESLNVIIRGFLRPGDHVLCSSVEHNAVMRPLVELEKNGIIFDRIPADSSGRLLTDRIEQMIRPNTRAVIMTHAGNVTGTIHPISEVGAICERRNIKFIVDSAQTAGLLPINMREMNIDVLCFTGHKSLLGPQGIGGFILDEEMISEIDPIISGGTGSVSHTEYTPDFMPDKFEAGTMNLPGIAGLNSALKWISERGIESIRSHELSLTERFIKGIENLEDEQKLKIVGIKGTEGRVGVVSLQTLKSDCADTAYLLDSEYGIATRVGMHCAPSAHKTLGTFPEGTLRFSFGVFNADDDVDAAVSALEKICK